MSAAKQFVRCPKCNRTQPATGGNDAIYFCPKCRMQFDNDPSEGGDYSNDPSKRLERQERRSVHQRRRMR